MIQAYWVFVAYVSPVLLVIACAYLAWRAVREWRKEDADESTGPGREIPPEREAWSPDPEAWKRGS